jgi:hypothetical protein
MTESISDLREAVLKTLDDLQSDLYPTSSAPSKSRITSAPSEIPAGTVSRRRHEFEEQITQHEYLPDIFYIERMKAHIQVLRAQNRTYAATLRSVEFYTLSALPHYLRDFIRDHENLHRAAIRSRARAIRADDMSVEMDVFDRITERVWHIDIVYALNMISQTMAPEERERLQHVPTFKKEFSELSKMLVDEKVRILTRLDVLLPRTTYEDAELENVGADHDVDDFGREVATQPSCEAQVEENDHSQDCCICLEGYDADTHPSFQISQCKHIIGKPCLAIWLNNISKNSNLCPHCRAELCQRRLRRPKSLNPTLVVEKDMEWLRLLRSRDIMDDIDRVHAEVFGEESGEGIVDRIFNATNMRLATNRIGFGFLAMGQGSRSLRRVIWAESR